MEKVELKRKVSLKRKEGLVSAPPPKKSIWWLWLLILVVIVIVVVFSIKNCSSEGNESNVAEPTTTEQQPVKTETQSTNKESSTIGTEESTVSNETASSTSVEKPITPKADSKPASVPIAENTSISQPVATNKTSLQGSLDEKAKQVIRGNFGNGDERKQNLGNEYSAIQQRVNEMYRVDAIN